MSTSNDELPGVSPEDQDFFREIRDSAPYDLGYKPSTTPDSDTWLGVDEGERLLAVIQYHLQSDQPWGQNLRLHSTAHVVAENQLAEGFEPAANALERLEAAGFSRHDAIHVIGSAAIQAMRRITQEGGSGPETTREFLETAVKNAIAKRS